MKTKKFNWALNVLTLVAMAAALVMAPMSPASADVVDAPASGPTAPDTVYNYKVWLQPYNAGENTHVIWLFQITTPVPYPGELYLDFDDLFEMDDREKDDGFPDALGLSAGDPDLEKMLITYAPAADLWALVSTTDMAQPQSTFPVSYTAAAGYYPPKETRTQGNAIWVPDNQIRLVIYAAGDTMPDPPFNPGRPAYFSNRDPITADYIRIDFWGLPAFNPDEMNAGIINPKASGTYTMCMATDEEHGPNDPDDPRVDDTGWGCVAVEVGPPLPVRLYRKMQIPTKNCGFTYLEYVRGFETIQASLDAANDIWMNQGDYVNVPSWNLFDTCPNFAELEPYDTREAAFLAYVDSTDPLKTVEENEADKGGVAVGAVIKVDADSDGDFAADIYNEVLYIDTPGLIIGSFKNETTLVENAVIEADGLNPMYTMVQGDHDQADPGDEYPGAVVIDAGGVTFGESYIQHGAHPLSVTHLYGFVVQNAGQNDPYEDDPDDIPAILTDPHEGADGIVVYPYGYKCMGEKPNSAAYYPPEDVYGFTVQTYGVLEVDGITPNFELGLPVTNTNQMTITEAGTGIYLIDVDVITVGSKIANLTNSWSGHVLAADLVAGDTVSVTLDILVTGRFTDGHAIAVFAPTANFDCKDARVDIRDNEILNSDYDTTAEWTPYGRGWDRDVAAGTRGGNGIMVYSAAVWVNGNDVYLNEADGFHGIELRSSGVLKVCDGIDRTDEMLEISGNLFHENGGGESFAGWGCTDYYPGDFNPLGNGNDSGIEIWSTDDIGDVPLYIHDNLIYENIHAGIWLDGDAANNSIRILWNEIYDNLVFGLSNWADAVNLDGDDFVEPTTAAEVDVIFKYNDIYGNGLDAELVDIGWGVKNWVYDYSSVGVQIRAGGGGGAMFNAKENYWGMDGDGLADPSGGPEEGPVPCRHSLDQRSEAMGYGDAVNKGTFYNPWLSVESNLLRVLPGYQHLRAYGSDSLLLQAGWNTLAVPLPLDSGANSLEDISALGTFLMEDGVPKWEAAYQYDNEAEAWLAIDGLWDPSKDIQAVHGYFIKIDALGGTRFPVIYGKMLVDLPAYDLVPGWNLIGSAFGIDREDNSDNDQGRWAVANPDDPDGEPEAFMEVEDALDSIIDWTFGYNGLSMIIDPWVPGQIDKGWPAPALTVWDAEHEDMATGEAYWVYMKTAGALGGFEYAPLFFDADPPLPAK